jgi:hypothetical protein
MQYVGAIDKSLEILSLRITFMHRHKMGLPAQFSAYNSPSTMHRAKFTEHISPRHNSPPAQFIASKIYRGTIHRAQLTEDNSPCTILRAQFIVSQFTKYNSPHKKNRLMNC